MNIGNADSGVKAGKATNFDIFADDQNHLLLLFLNTAAIAKGSCHQSVQISGVLKNLDLLLNSRLYLNRIGYGDSGERLSHYISRVVSAALSVFTSFSDKRFPVLTSTSFL